MEMKSVQTGDMIVNLPVVTLADTDIKIILFDSFSETLPLLQEIALEGVKKFTKPDVIICPEAKAIPMAQELARHWGINYCVLRKSKKLYMVEPKQVDVSIQSITNKAKQELWYDMVHMSFLKGKKAMIFDDVVSTGETLLAMLSFVKEHDLEVTSIATVYLEGESPCVQEIRKEYKFEYLGFLPLL